VRLIVEADGGSRGNPGPAGYGALVRDPSSQSIIARRNGFLGVVTNNVAEYRGLIAGLTAAAAVDPVADIEVRMDSKLVVEQMSGRWQIKHPDMRPLAKEANALAAGFASVRYQWIPRAQNGDADKLANEAMDARAGTYDALDDDLSVPVPLEASADESARTAASSSGGAGTWGAPPNAPPTQVVLLRHGQTALSIERRFSGIGDPKLTDLGRRQAAAAAERLAATGGFDAIISSPLSRARDTAAAVATRLGITPIIDEAWRECDFGMFEGLSAAEVREKYAAEFATWTADPANAPPGGESFVDVGVRVHAALAALVGATRIGQRILVVSHVTPIKVVGRYVLDAPPSAMRTLHLDLASIARVDLHASGGGVMRGWNDTAHVEALTA
jgi:broad specificity phosphatase PhoE/ribonuclease HI